MTLLSATSCDKKAMDTNKRFTLEELSILSGVSPRTIRYYMQKGLMDKPEGATRGSYYLAGHLEQLLLVKRWQAAGLSLERIQEIAGGAPAAVPEPLPKPGDVRVESRIYLAPGVHLCIDAARAGLTPETVRDLVRRIMEALAGLCPGDPRADPAGSPASLPQDQSGEGGRAGERSQSAEGGQAGG